VQLVNAYVEGYQLVLVHPDGSTSNAPLSYDYFVGSERISSKTWKQRKQRLESETRIHQEGDLSPVRRYLADHPDTVIARPRRAFLDIETDPRPGFARKHEMRILCWTIVAEDTGEMWTGVLQSDDDEAESVLLLEMWARLREFQCLTAWNGGDSWSDKSGFDFPVIRARSLRYWPDLRWKWDKFLWQCQLKCYKRLKFEEAGEDKSSYSLEAVSKRELGEGKEDYDSRQCYEDWRAGGERRERLVRYNQRDVELLRRIEQSSGMLELGHQVCTTCGVLPDTTGLHPTTFVDGFLLRLGGHRPTKVWTAEYKKKNYEGAYVREPSIRGIAGDVFFLDFNSLYPSIIRTLNASPDTKGQPGSVSPMTGVSFGTATEGLLPRALRVLMERKAEYKAAYKSHPEGSQAYLQAKMLHDGYKAIVNSFYGVLGSTASPWYDKDIARSITLGGQFFIKAVEAEAEAKGLRPVAGDTDSLGVTDCTVHAVHEFVTHCNTVLFPQIIQNHRGIPGVMKLAFDKHYDRFINGVKDDGTPAKKKYLGRFAGTGEVCITGFEYKRGDASPLARQLQEKVARKLMSDPTPDPDDYTLTLIEMRTKVLYEELGREEIVMSESIRKELDEYETVSPAISAARILKERGEDVSPGTRIRFIVVDGNVSPMRVIPESDFKGEWDRYHTWETNVYPPTQRLLMAAFPEYDWAQFASVRPAKDKVCAEAKYQAKLELRGQRRLFSGF
jgi:DNA polymerase elongation subunit (family B)